MMSGPEKGKDIDEIFRKNEVEGVRHGFKI